MTNKLTCKMSDGAEWGAKEIGECNCSHECGETLFSMKPIETIKREPREGYMLQRRSDKRLLLSRKEVEAVLFMERDRGDLEIIKVREVLE